MLFTNIAVRYQKYINLLCMIIIALTSIVGISNLLGADGNSLNLINGDFTWNRQFAVKIIDGLNYPAITDTEGWVLGFGYPVPMSMLLYLLAGMPYVAVNLIYVIGYAFVPLAGFALLQRVCGMEKNCYRWVISLVAFFACWEYIQFDIRSFNINTLLFLVIILALYMLKKDRDIWAGVFLGLSVVLKLYSVFLLPLWFYQKKYKAGISAICFLILAFIVLPGVFLGFREGYDLSMDWLYGVMEMSRAEASLLMNYYLVSLPKAVVTSFGGDQHIGLSSLSTETWEYINIILNLFKAVWVLAVVLALILIKRSDSSDKFLRMSFVLLLFPIPLSPILQPHHMTIIIPAMFLICQKLFDAEAVPGKRILLAFVPVIAFTFAQIYNFHEYIRGYYFTALVSILIMSLVYMPGSITTDAGSPE